MYDIYKTHQSVNNLFIAFSKYYAGITELLLKQDFRMDAYTSSVLALITKAVQELYSNPFNLVMRKMQWYSSVNAKVMDFMMGQQCSAQPTQDNRFKDESWNQHNALTLVRDLYLENSKWLMSLIEDMHGLSSHDKLKMEFWSRWFVDMFSPANFLQTNPAALKEAFETNYESLVRGADNFLNDVRRSNKFMKIETTDDESFEVGRNIAATKGKVVFQTDLMQLIQYSPQTEEVHDIPMLIVTAWINKYYILDLQQDNSLINWLINQKYTVFVISWVNPDDKLRHKEFGDYMKEGVIAALDFIKAAYEIRKVNIIGYCLGGTLVASTDAYLTAIGKNDIINSESYLTTLLDFSECGEIAAFIDDAQVSQIEDDMKQAGGVMDGNAMAATFSMLRARDMIWSFYVNNYLMGKKVRAFDILFWNADSTNLPELMHSFYLRNMYLRNLLVKPGAVKVCGVGIDLTKTKDIPRYVLATKEDHIAPAVGVYKSKLTFGKNAKFVLSGSGHVAGIVNPPHKNKYYYMVNNSAAGMPDVKYETWLQGAKEHKGSWWVDFNAWLKPLSGKLIKPPKFPTELEEAPGSYVKKRV